MYSPNFQLNFVYFAEQNIFWKSVVLIASRCPSKIYSINSVDTGFGTQKHFPVQTEQSRVSYQRCCLCVCVCEEDFHSHSHSKEADFAAASISSFDTNSDGRRIFVVVKSFSWIIPNQSDQFSAKTIGKFG